MYHFLSYNAHVLECASRTRKWRLHAHSSEGGQPLFCFGNEERELPTYGGRIHQQDYHAHQDVYWKRERSEDSQQLLVGVSSRIGAERAHLQLLDEVADFGIPVITEPSIMTSLIMMPTMMNKAMNFVTKVAVRLLR